VTKKNKIFVIVGFSIYYLENIILCMIYMLLQCRKSGNRLYKLPEHCTEWLMFIAGCMHLKKKICSNIGIIVFILTHQIEITNWIILSDRYICRVIKTTNSLDNNFHVFDSPSTICIGNCIYIIHKNRIDKKV